MLLNLEGNITQECLSDFMFSGPGGISLTSQYGDIDEPICDDIDLDEVCDDIDDCIGCFVVKKLVLLIVLT